MNGVAVGAAVEVCATAHVAVKRYVKQVVERQPVVVSKGDPALVFSGSTGAAVICKQANPQGKRLLVSDDQIALTRLRIGACSGLDLNIDLGCGHTREVLQRFQIHARSAASGVPDIRVSA